MFSRVQNAAYYQQLSTSKLSSPSNIKVCPQCQYQLIICQEFPSILPLFYLLFICLGKEVRGSVLTFRSLARCFRPEKVSSKKMDCNNSVVIFSGLEVRIFCGLNSNIELGEKIYPLRTSIYTISTFLPPPPSDIYQKDITFAT